MRTPRLALVALLATLTPAHAQDRDTVRRVRLELHQLKLDRSPENAAASVKRAMTIAAEHAAKGETQLTYAAISTAISLDAREALPACVALITERPSTRRQFVNFLDRFLSLPPCPETSAILAAVVAAAREGELRSESLITLMNSLKRALHAGYADRDMVKRAMIDIVCTSPPGAGAYAAEFYADQLAQPADIPRYRRIADHALAAGRLHPVLWFLAELGDQPTGEKLRAYRDAHDATLRGSPRGFIDHVIWRIEVQASPQTLLEALRSGPPGLQRPWMIQRAVALGIPPAEIEPALREFIASAADIDDPAWEYLHPRTIAKAKELGIFPPSEPEPEPTTPEISFTP